MDVWIIINPILRVFFYAASFVSIGAVLFSLHFKKFLTVEQKAYCDKLAFKTAPIGSVVSLLMFFSIAGNLGGDIASVIEPLMLRLAIESKSGIGFLTAFIGFMGLFMAHRLRGHAIRVGLLVSSAVVLFSFIMSGHSQLGGFATQALLIIHLLCISFWLGALMPFRWMCLQPDPYNLSIVAHRFGILAMGYVAQLLSAGLGYAYLLLGDVTLIVTTQYGNVLLVKIVLVVALLILAALNKFKLVPSLETRQAFNVYRFQRSIHLEIIIALLILTASSLITTSVTLPMAM